MNGIVLIFLAIAIFVIAYLTYGKWLPEYEKDERLPLFDSNKMTVLFR